MKRNWNVVYKMVTILSRPQTFEHSFLYFSYPVMKIFQAMVWSRQATNHHAPQANVANVPWLCMRIRFLYTGIFFDIWYGWVSWQYITVLGVFYTFAHVESVVTYKLLWIILIFISLIVGYFRKMLSFDLSCDSVGRLWWTVHAISKQRSLPRR